jgi:hypothetical protein
MEELQNAESIAGERMYAPQVSDMNITDDSAERPHYCHGRYWKIKGTIFRTEGYLLVLIEYF